MRILIKDTNGHTHTSDSFTWEDWLEEFSGNVENAIYEFNEFISILKDLSSVTSISITIEHASRFFNPNYIVWISVEDAQEFVDATGVSL